MTLIAPDDIKGPMLVTTQERTSARLNWAIDQSEAGYSLGQIALALGISVQAVSQLFQRHGYKPKPPSRRAKRKKAAWRIPGAPTRKTDHDPSPHLLDHLLDGPPSSQLQRMAQKEIVMNIPTVLEEWFISPAGPFIQFIPMHPLAQLPCYTTAEAAGADIRAVDGEILSPGERRVIRTGLGCVIPQGWELQVRARSGMAAARGVTVLNAPGTIDSDYTGELGIILINTGHDTFYIEPGDRIAQVVIAPVVQASFGWATESRQTDRADGGFGSTGAN